MRNRGWYLLGGLVICVGVGIFSLRYALEGMTSLEPGMMELHPTGTTTLYLRRQAVFGKPADLYLSSDPDLCKPYDRWHDFKFGEPMHGAADSPLLISYADNVIVVHSPTAPKLPWFSSASTLRVRFEPLSLAEYNTYALSGSTKKLPVGWSRVTVPFGHNTCAL